MLAFIGRRVLYGIFTLLVISVVSFIIMDLPPGDAATAKINKIQAQGTTVSEEFVQSLRESLHVDDPLPLKYGYWIRDIVLHGDFGDSTYANAPVLELISGRLPYSVLLGIGALVVAWGLAIPIGVYSATHRYSLPDYAITTLQFIAVAIPEFLLALLILVGVSVFFGADVSGLFSREYEDAPWSFGRLLDFLGHVWVPILVIAAGSTAWLTRVMRANLLDVLNQQYVQTARAKGVLEKRVIWKHAVRNAFHPLVMALGTSLPIIISGEVLVGIVLNLPTLGPLLIRALKEQDMFLAGGVLMMSSLMLVIGNLLADILLAKLDPRVRTAE